MKTQRFHPHLFSLLTNHRQIVSMLIALAFLILAAGCRYYRAKSSTPTPENFAESLKKAGINERYIVIHQNSKVVNLTNVSLDEENKMMSGDLKMVEYKHRLYELTESRRSKKYHKSKVDKTLELHLFMKDGAPPIGDTGAVSIPFGDVSRMDVYKTDVARTVASVVGLSIPVVLIVTIALKSSCPFVYAGPDGQVAFVGELYPGAIIPSLQRTDYLPMPPSTPADSRYTISVTNELLEKQFTDELQLLMVTHAAGAEVLLDQAGKPQTIANPLAPESASVGRESILSKDDKWFGFDVGTTGDDFPNIDLSFKNVAKSHQAKLVLRAKNSMWLEHVYGKFNQSFGSYFNNFQRQQRKSPAEKSIAWRNNQGIPLSVYVKDAARWRLAERINTVGPMAYRDMVVAINLGENPEAITEIRLETGFMFWDLDYAALDFSTNQSVTVKALSPVTARDENGADVKKQLSQLDQAYLVQPEIGNEATLTYEIKAVSPNTQRTFFLKNSGYYEYIRNYTGKPDTEKLKSFRLKGALSRFSKELFNRVNSQEAMPIALSHD